MTEIEKFSYSQLKTRHRAERDGYPFNLSLRVHRALSWLNRAEQSEDDDDARFIFFWISFNAAYANELNDHDTFGEQARFGKFIAKMCNLDSDNQLYETIWLDYSDHIRILLENKYVYQPFWDYHNALDPDFDWEEKFARAKQSTQSALAKMNTHRVLCNIFSRMYTLRNQLIHGGATWNSAVNREQLRDCCAILGKIVPTIIVVMMDHPKTLWGDPCYPVVED